MMSDDNIDNDRKNIFNEVMLTKCNENMIIIETSNSSYNTFFMLFSFAILLICSFFVF